MMAKLPTNRTTKERARDWLAQDSKHRVIEDVRDGAFYLFPNETYVGLLRTQFEILHKNPRTL